MTFGRRILLCIGFCITLGAPALAEVPPMSKQQLTQAATLIASGYVTAISERDEVTYPDHAKLVVAHETVTMVVTHVEKGALPPAKPEIRFTGWHITEQPPHWVGGSNTLRLPLQIGDSIKVYLAREGSD